MLFEQIDANKRKTIFIMLFFFMLISGMGATFGIIYNNDAVMGTAIASIIAFVYIAIMSLNSSSIVMAMNHAKHIESREQNPLLWDTVEQMAMVAQIPMPKVYIVPDASINAFATGFSPKSSAVAVTSGLLEQLEQYELEAVVAHEISHIRNYDVRLATIALALVATITFMSDFARHAFHRGNSKSFSSGKGGKNNGAAVIYIVALILIIIAPILATLLQFFLSRNREYLADASAVELTRNPAGLINALEKISWQDVVMTKGSPSSQSIYFAAFQDKKKEKAGWFDTHPPISLRIERLQNM